MSITIAIIYCIVCAAFGLMIGACLTAAKRGDAVEVVRCNEFRLKDTEECPMSEFEAGDDIYDYSWITPNEGYCSYGERKDASDEI